MQNDHQIFVKRERLSGYREPTVSEKNAIWTLVKDDVQKRCKKARIKSIVLWGILIYMIGVCFYIEVFLKNPVYMALGVAGVLLSITGAMMGTAVKNNIYLSRHKIYHGEFEVLDVVSNRFEMTRDKRGGKMVRISDARGRHCSDSFPIDEEYVEKNRRAAKIPMLLMRDAGSGYYRVFPKNVIREASDWCFESLEDDPDDDLVTM